MHRKHNVRIAFIDLNGSGEQLGDHLWPPEGLERFRNGCSGATVGLSEMPSPGIAGPKTETDVLDYGMQIKNKEPDDGYRRLLANVRTV